MKLILRIITVFVLMFGVVQILSVNAEGPIKIEGWTDIIDGSKPKINVDCANSDCSITKGTDLVKNSINDIEKDKTFSEYVQDIVFYILTFVSLIALLYIIYAGFTVLTSAGDDEKAKNAKKIILSVIIGIVLIWLAYPITLFIMKMLNATTN